MLTPKGSGHSNVVLSFLCPAHRFSEGGGNGLLDFPKPVSEHSVSTDISLCHGALWKAVIDQDSNFILGDAEAHSKRNEGVAEHMWAWQVANLFSFHSQARASLAAQPGSTLSRDCTCPSK